MLVAASVSAASVSWRLSARNRFSGQNAFVLTHYGFAGATRVAVSIRTKPSQTIPVFWKATCTSATSRGVSKTTTGRYTSHGLGAKVPIRLGVKRAYRCNISAQGAPIGTSVRSGYVSLWRN